MYKSILLSEEKEIDVYGGNIYHVIKKTSRGFNGFGEAYFSSIDFGFVKAWKRHKKMTLNIYVPIGAIKFVLFDDRDKKNSQFKEYLISEKNNHRLTIPPMVWFGFIGVSEKTSMLLNVADLIHIPSEVDRKESDFFDYEWSSL